MENTETKPASSKKGLIILIIVLVAGSVAAFIWWRNYEKYIATNDANLDSYRISVSSMVMAKIKKQLVEEGDKVNKGELLVELDSSEVKSKQAELDAQKKELEAQLALMKINKVTAQKTLEMREASFKLAKENYDRANLQYSQSVLPLEALQTSEEAQTTSRIACEVAKSQLNAATVQITSTEASIQAVQSQIESALVELAYYRIYAPTEGIIGKRWMLPGDIVQPGQTLYTLNQDSALWLSIYLEETKYENVFIGQQVKYELDAYPKLTFWGKIYYIGDNTASQFSMIPPSNASGNFTKVTQRIPIKISIDSISGDRNQISKVKLVSGMSAEVKIIK
ncbi:MAG: HlyD family secretion protein [Bacteroidales bacterium]